MLWRIALLSAVSFGCHSKPAETDPADASARAPAIAPDLLAESLWSNNQTYVYEVNLSSSAGVAGALPLAQYDLHGSLVVHARQTSPSSTQLAINVADATFRTTKSDAQPMYDALAKELMRPILIGLSQGAIVDERIPQNLSAFAESILRYLGAAFQLRAAGGQRGFESTERDVIGVYHAAYDTNADGTQLVRTKLRYEPVPVPGKGPAVGGGTFAANVVSSKATLNIKDHVLQSIVLNESLGAPVANGSAVSSSTALKLTFKANSPTVTLVSWDSLVREGIAVQPGHMNARPGNTAQYDSLRIGDFSFDKALAALSESAKRLASKAAKDESSGPSAGTDSAAQEKEIGNDARVFSAMAALLRQDTANVDRALQLISNKHTATNHLMDALAAAGTAPAQKALLQVIENAKLDKTTRLRGAVALARVARATPDTVAGFEKILHAHGFETAACYGLGTIARRLRENGDFAGADAISATLIGELKQSKSDDWSAVVLRGIANSGNGKAFDTVEPFFKEPNARLREAAVEAVRLMLEPRVEVVLQSIIANETDDSVRVAALDACLTRNMTPALLQTVSSAGLTAKSTRVRQHAIRVLSVWAPQNPEALSALKSITALEANPSLLRAAEKAEQRVAQ